MDGMKQARVVIEASVNGRDEDSWHPVHEKEVPEWVKDPDNMARMVLRGEQCMKCDEGDKGSLWYRARVLEAEING